MKNKLFSFFIVFFVCGKAYALPQDWPCFALVVEKKQTVEISETEYTHVYQGETNGYDLKITLSGIKDKPHWFGDCGTAGCSGELTEISTGRTETLSFFCELPDETDETKALCYAGSGEEFILKQKTNQSYEAPYCTQSPHETIQVNLSDCQKCHCTLYWYNDKEKRTTGNKRVGCTKEENGLHCFTCYGYEAWRDYIHQLDDFENCVGLNL